MGLGVLAGVMAALVLAGMEQGSEGAQAGGSFGPVESVAAAATACVVCDAPQGVDGTHDPAGPVEDLGEGVSTEDLGVFEADTSPDVDPIDPVDPAAVVDEPPDEELGPAAPDPVAEPQPLADGNGGVSEVDRRDPAVVARLPDGYERRLPDEGVKDVAGVPSGADDEAGQDTPRRRERTR